MVEFDPSAALNMLIQIGTLGGIAYGFLMGIKKYIKSQVEPTINDIHESSKQLKPNGGESIYDLVKQIAEVQGGLTTREKEIIENKRMMLDNKRAIDGLSVKFERHLFDHGKNPEEDRFTD